MSLDLKLTEEEAERYLGDYSEVGLSRKTKPHGYPNPVLTTKFNNDWMHEAESLSDLVFGMYLFVKPVVDFAAENADVHGGDRVKMSLKYSDKGVLVCVKHNGEGFDARKVVGSFSRGKEYYLKSGKGFKGMDESQARVGFNQRGNVTIVFYAKDLPDPFFIERAKKHRETFSSRPVKLFLLQSF